MSFGLWLERVLETRRLRGVCGKVIRRLLSLRASSAFHSWLKYRKLIRHWTACCSEAERILYRFRMKIMRSFLSHWFRFIKKVERLRTVGQIVFCRYRHDILLSVLWSWRWSFSYRQLALEKLASRRIKTQQAHVFKVMQANMKPSRSWLMDRFQNHILVSRVFDAWAAAFFLSSSICALIHRHYTFPAFVAWKGLCSIIRKIRKLFMNRTLARWRALVNHRHWIRVSFSALLRHSLQRCVKTAFDKWRYFGVGLNFHLKFATLFWRRHTRISVGVRMFTNILKSQKMIKIFKAWKGLVDAAQFAPVF
jgi:hypothetical protein